MRNSTQRGKKYEAKLDGVLSHKQIAAHREGFGGAAGNQVQHEALVKTVLTRNGVMPGLNHFYMDFGKKLGQLMGNYSGGTLVTEACAAWTHWLRRGLDEDILNEILCLYMPSLCDENLDQYGIPWTGQVTVYQAGDDGTYIKGRTLTRPIVKGAGGTRWVDNGDGTATDLATGLMWIRDPAGSLGAPFNASITWANAIIACEALVFAGHSDWRLPNITELITIIDRGVFGPAWDVIFSGWAGRYWSSTTDISSTDRACYAHFWIGDAETALKTDLVDNYYARPVRGGIP